MTSNDLTTFDGNDGFEDAANDYSENLLRGDLLKCTDGHWLVGRESAPLPHGTRLVALGTAAAFVRWEGGKPVEYHIRRPGERMPEREELGYTDESTWEVGPDGQPRDPLQNTRFLWLTNPATAAVYTFTTSSWSGRAAVIGLGDQITRMRIARPGVSPVLEFESAPQVTKFGRKMKPVLKIVAWVGGGGGGADLKQIGGPKGGGTPPVMNDMMDEVPF